MKADNGFQDNYSVVVASGTPASHCYGPAHSMPSIHSAFIIITHNRFRGLKCQQLTAVNVTWASTQPHNNMLKNSRKTSPAATNRILSLSQVSSLSQKGPCPPLLVPRLDEGVSSATSWQLPLESIRLPKPSACLSSTSVTNYCRV